jgi:hypothetical protein
LQPVANDQSKSQPEPRVQVPNVGRIFSPSVSATIRKSPVTVAMSFSQIPSIVLDYAFDYPFVTVGLTMVFGWFFMEFVMSKGEVKSPASLVVGSIDFVSGNPL